MSITCCLSICVHFSVSLLNKVDGLNSVEVGFDVRIIVQRIAQVRVPCQDDVSVGIGDCKFRSHQELLALDFVVIQIYQGLF